MKDIELGDMVYYLTVDGIKRDVVVEVNRRYTMNREAEREEVVGYVINNDKSVMRASSYNHERPRESIFKTKEDLIKYIEGLE